MIRSKTKANLRVNIQYIDRLDITFKFLCMIICQFDGRIYGDFLAFGGYALDIIAFFREGGGYSQISDEGGGGDTPILMHDFGLAQWWF